MSVDQNICEFYDKTCSCKHFESCTKIHRIYNNTNTLVFINICPYIQADQVQKDDFFSNVFEDLFLFCDAFGYIQDAVLAINENHLFGNFYIQFSDPIVASRCADSLSNKYYAGKQICVKQCKYGCLKLGICDSFSRNRCYSTSCSFIHYFDAKSVAQKLFKHNKRHFNSKK